jgi:hypothetical protein
MPIGRSELKLFSEIGNLSAQRKIMGIKIPKLC